MDVELRNVSLADVGDSVGSPPSTRFVASIRSLGVVQPVLLAETTTEAGELQFLIIDGNRRIHAARKAKMTEISAIIVSGTSIDQRAQLTLVTNGFRSANYLTEFWAIKALERRNFESSQISRLSGMSESVLANRNALSDLNREIFVGLRNSKVSQSNALTISRMDRQNQEKLAAILRYKGRILKSDVDHHVSTVRTRDKAVDYRYGERRQSESIKYNVAFIPAGTVSPTETSGTEAESIIAVHKAISQDRTGEIADHSPAPLHDTPSDWTGRTPAAASVEFDPSIPGPVYGNPTSPELNSQPGSSEPTLTIQSIASRPESLMRTAVVAAQVLDYSREDFLSMAAQIWDSHT